MRLTSHLATIEELLETEQVRFVALNVMNRQKASKFGLPLHPECILSDLTGSSLIMFVGGTLNTKLEQANQVLKKRCGMFWVHFGTTRMSLPPPHHSAAVLSVFCSPSQDIFSKCDKCQCDCKVYFTDCQSVDILPVDQLFMQHEVDVHQNQTLGFTPPGGAVWVVHGLRFT